MTTNGEFQQIAQATNIGQLGILTDDGYPRVVSVNFVTIGDLVYFHGANHGEKYDAFAAGQKVTLSIDLPYAMIPSYWEDAEQACRANQFFKSALVKGRGAVVDDSGEKAAALQALMQKHQPEGGFRTITASDDMYRKHVADTMIFRIDPDQITTRCEMGQRLSAEKKAQLVKQLETRGSETDLLTAAEIRKQINLEN
jgi:hypothetical protein